MATTMNACAITKRLAELELSERIIRDYILNLEGCDAVRFTYKPDTSIYYTPYVYGATKSMSKLITPPASLMLMTST